MVESVVAGGGAPPLLLSPAVQAILRPLCEGGCHAFGDIAEWCESRGDCSYAVVCPTCDARFVVDDDELAELRRWTAIEGGVLSCGVRWD